jgi:predicted HTH transcriptional regulator
MAMAALAVLWRCGNSTGAALTATTFSQWTNITGRTGLEYCAEGIRQTLEQVWLRVQSYQGDTPEKLVLRPRQEQLLRLLRDHRSLSPAEIWEALAISRQGAMDLLRPLLAAGLVEKVGGPKNGRYQLKKR